MVPGQPFFVGERVQQAQTCRRTLRHGHRDGLIQPDHRGRPPLHQQSVQGDDPRPVGIRCGSRLVVDGGDRGLHLVGPERLGGQRRRSALPLPRCSPSSTAGGPVRRAEPGRRPVCCGPAVGPRSAASAPAVRPPRRRRIGPRRLAWSAGSPPRSAHRGPDRARSWSPAPPQVGVRPSAEAPDMR